jgi:predicted RNA-binding protein
MAEGKDEPAAEGLGETGPASLSPAAAMAIGVRRGHENAVSDEAFDAFLRKQSRLTDLQTEHLHEQRELILSRLRWGRFSDRLRALLQAFTVLVGLALAVVLAVMAWRAHEDRGYVIEAFTTPPALAQQGLTGEALAGEIMDHISTIERVTASGSISRSDQVKADRREDFKVEIPETGLSLTEVWRALRDVLGSERKIEGDLRQGAGGGLVLTVRVVGEPAVVVRGAAGDLDALEQQAAEQVFAITGSGNYVVYLDIVGRRLEAIGKAKELAAQDIHFIPLWYPLEQAVDPHKARELAKLAERTQPGSPYAWFEALRAERDLGHAEAELFAAIQLRDAMRRRLTPELSGRGGDELRGLATATLARLSGDYPAADRADAAIKSIGDDFTPVEDDAWRHDLGAARDRLAQVLIAAKPDPAGEARARYAIDAAAGDWPAAAADARALMAADDAARLKDPVPEGMPGLARVQGAHDTPLLAEAELRLGHAQAAQTLIAATPLDAYDALREWGRIAEALGDLAAADHWFAEAVRQAPSLPFAYRDWAEALLARGRPDAALAKLQIAAAKGPRFADVAELEGEARLAKKDYAGAVAAFARAGKLAPNWGHNHLLWGQALKLSGHEAEARAQFTAAGGLGLDAADMAVVKGLSAGGG